MNNSVPVNFRYSSQLQHLADQLTVLVCLRKKQKNITQVTKKIENTSMKNINVPIYLFTHVNNLITIIMHFTIKDKRSTY